MVTASPQRVDAHILHDAIHGAGSVGFVRRKTAQDRGLECELMEG
jgi:hypothetical protein